VEWWAGSAEAFTMLAHGMPGVRNSWFRRSQDSDSRVDAVLNPQDRDYEE